MRALVLMIATLMLTACGGGSSVAPAPAAAAAPPVQTTADVVMIGDSITYLWNDPTWQNMTHEDLISTHLPGVVDAGISGQTCPEMAARFQHDVLDLHPRVVVIMCGTNDVFHLQSLDSQADEFSMVQAALASGARVIVGEMPPDAYEPGSAGWQLHAQWNANVISAAASYGYEVADYYDPMMLPDGTRNAALFAPGSAHPVAAGYAVMWAVLSGKL